MRALSASVLKSCNTWPLLLRALSRSALIAALACHGKSPSTTMNFGGAKPSLPANNFLILFWVVSHKSCPVSATPSAISLCTSELCKWISDSTRKQDSLSDLETEAGIAVLRFCCRVVKLHIANAKTVQITRAFKRWSGRVFGKIKILSKLLFTLNYRQKMQTYFIFTVRNEPCNRSYW